MGFKQLGGALLAVLVLGAITTSSAFATNNWRSSNEKGQWYVEGSKLVVGGATQDVNVESTEPTKIQTTIGTVPLDITVTSVSCLNCSLDQAEGPKGTVDGAFVFQGVSVSEPAGCSIAEEFQTETLSGVLGMNTAGTTATFKFAPKEGTTFAKIKLTGATCAIAGTYKVTGVLFARLGNGTNIEAVGQAIEMNKEIQVDAGEENSLRVGEKPAFLSSKIKATLVSGKSWKGNES